MAAPSKQQHKLDEASEWFVRTEMVDRARASLTLFGAPLYVRVICGGRHLTAMRTAAIAEARTLFGDCPGIISFGVAGGLAPQLRPGTCIIGSEILSGSNRMPTSKIWSQQLLEEFSDAVSGMIVGVTAPVSDPRDKHALYLNTSAIAVDMESHIVATVGASHRLLPVAATRVITEPAERGLPACAVAAMRPNGTTNIAAMISSALKPREIPALFQTALDALVARAMLVRGRRLLGPVLSRVTLPGTWNPPSGSRCCAPNVLVEINGHQVVPFSGA